jgi:hypothetical protein
MIKTTAFGDTDDESKLGTVLLEEVPVEVRST